MEKEYYVVLVNQGYSAPSVFKYNDEDSALTAASQLVNPPSCIVYVFEGRSSYDWYGEARLIKKVDE